MTISNQKILTILLTLTIILELASIAIWYALPDWRLTLVVDYSIASLSAAVVAILNIIALIGIIRKSVWGPLLVIAVSIPNRIAGLFLFENPLSTGIFALWTLILVVFAYMSYREIKYNQ